MAYLALYLTLTVATNPGRVTFRKPRRHNGRDLMELHLSRVVARRSSQAFRGG